MPCCNRFKQRTNVMAVSEPEERSFTWRRPLELFEEEKIVKICAPMVRYSKLPFRMLVRKYGTDLAFTPMILADAFVQSLKARDSEFTTCPEDRPLVVQFAAHNAQDLADAAEIVAPFSDGVDLNCGCPQRWAMAEGYGACLIRKPELVKEMVTAARSRVSDPNFSVSIKIRIHNDIRETVDLCQKAEQAGVSWISVHGRTKDQRSQPVNLEAIAAIKAGVSIPVIANGDIKSLQDVREVAAQTGVNGVMSARGILANPAFYAGYEEIPPQCLEDWLNLSLSLGNTYHIFHNHLIYMLEHTLCRSERRIFNSLSSTASVLDFLSENLGISPSKQILHSFSLRAAQQDGIIRLLQQGENPPESGRQTGGLMARQTNGLMAKQTDGLMARHTDGLVTRQTDGLMARQTDGLMADTQMDMTKHTDGLMARHTDGHGQTDQRNVFIT